MPLPDRESAERLAVWPVRLVDGDDGSGRAVDAPRADLLTHAVREVRSARAMADRSQLERRGAVIFSAADGEVGERAASHESWAADRDRGGAESGVHGGALVGDSAGAGLGGGEPEPH